VHEARNGSLGLERGDDVSDPFAEWEALDREEVHFVMERLEQSLDFVYP